MTISVFLFISSKNFKENLPQIELARIDIPLKALPNKRPQTPNSPYQKELGNKKNVTIDEKPLLSETEEKKNHPVSGETSNIEQELKNKVEEENTTELLYEPNPKDWIAHKKTITDTWNNAGSQKLRLAPVAVKPLWRVNAVKSRHLEEGTQIAIVIDDAGVDRVRTRHAIALTGPLTISFLPYATELLDLVKLAKNAGHEIMTHVPMEPFNKQLDPGPNFLTVADRKENIRNKIKLALSKVPGSVGINNHMGSLFTSDIRAMKVIMEELRLRGLLFLDSRTSPKTVALELASKHQVPFVTRNVFLDHEPRLNFILAQLDVLEGLAKKQGYAVAIAHPRTTTIEALSQWLPVIAEKGLELVPISSIVARRMGIPQNQIKLSVK